VIAAAQAHRNAARWTVALAIGLRQSEALGLRWADVDLVNGTLTVRRLHRVAGQGLVYEEPKAERSRRTLALPIQLVDALRAHRAAPTPGAQHRRFPLGGPRPRLRAGQRAADRAEV
jgi:integrase